VIVLIAATISRRCSSKYSTLMKRLIAAITAAAADP